MCAIRMIAADRQHRHLKLVACLLLSISFCVIGLTISTRCAGSCPSSPSTRLLSAAGPPGTAFGGAR
jgi:hypothetical protein